MFTVNDDLSIYVTRGDMVFLKVTADNNGEAYTFQEGEIVRFKVYRKKGCEDVVLQKDFPVTKNTQEVEIILEEADTKIGEVISKPVDYWYEVELNPFDNPQTIIGYDGEGTKVFRLFPEGRDLTENDPVITPEDIPVVDTELDLTSKRPVENQVIARAFLNLQGGYQATHDAVANLHVTPQMYGAIGDGEADDTEAIQKAIDAIGEGQTFRLPDGTYRLSKQVEIAKDLSIVSVTGEVVGRGFRIVGADVSISGVKFRDINFNAIEIDSNTKLTIDKCRFENIGISDDLNPSSQGCAVYASGGFEVKVLDSNFTKCHGHGAVFCNGEGTIEVKGSHFSSNYHRAIHLYGTGIIKGIVSDNYIEDCGKYNDSGSGVGCNGIYSTNGTGVALENNTILRSRENAIEGKFLKVVGNYIDGTGVEIETKPTPSIEGIFIEPSVSAYVANNIILNAGGFGIKSYRDTAITEPIYIIGNIIRGSGKGAIDINSPVSVSNMTVADNVVDGDINLNNVNDTVVYIGEISRLNGKPDISKNRALIDYHHYFDEVSPFTYSNCSPTIKTSDGVSCVEVAYQEYAKLIYALPALKNTKHILDFAVLGKGKFTVNLTKNNAYYKSVLTVDSNDYVDKHFIMPLSGEISDKFKISIEFQATSCIKTIDIQLYR